MVGRTSWTKKGPGATVIAALCVLAGSSAARAQTAPAEQPSTARGLALGGTHALQTSTGAVEYNPAGLALARVYHMDSWALYDADTTAITTGAAVADSFSNTVAMGLSYAYTFTGGDRDEHTGHDVRLALALPLGTSAAIGVTGRYVNFTQMVTQAGEVEQHSEDLVDTITLDVGLALRLGSRLYVAAVGQNLTDTGSRWAPLLLGGSLGLVPIDILALSADVTFDFTSYDHAAGRYTGAGELLLAGRFPLRAAYSYDAGRRAHIVSGGLGYVDQRFALDLSMRQDVAGGSDTVLAAGFRVFVR